MVTKREGEKVKILQKTTKSLLFLMLTIAFLLWTETPAQAATDVIAQAKKTDVPSGELVSNSNGIRYRYATGKYAKNKWYSIDGAIYYLGSNGYAPAGWFTYEGKIYYAGKKSVVCVKKWLTLNGKKYYLKSDGTRAVKTWVKKSGKYYYLGSDGAMVVSSQIAHNGNYYYVGSDGSRKSNCWVISKGKRYFFGKNGVRYQNKWIKYKGKYYYLDKNGVMAADCWVGDYYVGSDGARKVNCKVDGYYLDATGKKVKIEKVSGSYLIVGDSRTVGMSLAVSSSEVKFIGKVSMGYNWLKSVAGPQVRRYLAGNQKLKVVFAFGINDLGNINSYISYYETLQKEFPSVKFYYMSVNPVNESVASAHGYSVKNAAIKTFNSKLKKTFGSQYINTYSYLTKNGFSTADGIHYVSSTYQKLYQYLMKKIG